MEAEQQGWAWVTSSRCEGGYSAVQLHLLSQAQRLHAAVVDDH